jgi:hypothetical protein
MESWLVILIIAELAFVGWLLWLFLNYRLRREQSRVEERERLLARFTTSQELSDFLSSPAGERLFDSQSRISRKTVRALTGAFTTGVILLCMGAGFFLMGWVGNPAGDRIYVPAILFSVFGFGVLISAVISAFLVRRSGLMPRNGEGRGTEEP